jgi:hypothetical protein
MPMPHGTRGGMAFSADELRVLRHALAHALHSRPERAAADADLAADADAPVDANAAVDTNAAADAETVQEYVRIAEAIAETTAEAGRLRAFLLAELARYRSALPGTAAGYLERLDEALDAGYLPAPEDRAALRGLLGLPSTPAERLRRTALATRCRERLTPTPTPRPMPRPVPTPAATLHHLPVARERGVVALTPTAIFRAHEPTPTPADLWPPRRTA